MDITGFLTSYSRAAVPAGLGARSVPEVVGPGHGRLGSGTGWNTMSIRYRAAFAVTLCTMVHCTYPKFAGRESCRVSGDGWNDAGLFRHCLKQSGLGAWIVGSSGRTVLHDAAQQTGNPEIVVLLLEAGADPDRRTGSGETALHFGVLNGNSMIAVRLLEAGAEVNARNNQGYTPLHWATAGNDNERVLSLLLAVGADPVAMGGDGRTPLHFALLFRDRRTAGPVVGTLLQGGAGPELTPVHLAVLAGDSEGLVAALGDGADPDARDSGGWAPLHFGALAARWTGEFSIIADLVAAGATPDPRDRNGQTPLELAIQYKGSSDVVEALLAAGADPGRGGAETSGAGHSPLHLAATTGDSTLVTLLLRAGAGPDVRDTEGNTPLHWAAAHSEDPAVVRALIRAGADTDVTNAAGARASDLLATNEALANAPLSRHTEFLRWLDPLAEAVAAGRVFRDCDSCPRMVVVPAGSFKMGSPSAEAGRMDFEGPQHTVRIESPFAVGVYEVTFGEWDRCVSAGGCGGYRPDDEGWGRGNRPVINVSWGDAMMYTRWLSREVGHLYRLPTEAEWEYAARAGTSGARYWGESEAEQCRYGNGFDRNLAKTQWGREEMEEFDWLRAAPCSDGNPWTATVGSYEPNPFGLYDVLGNVYEWTGDCWRDRHSPTLDGRRRSSGDCSLRALRGGAWYDAPGNLRSALRVRYMTQARGGGTGFRVVRSIEPDPEQGGRAGW